MNEFFENSYPYAAIAKHAPNNFCDLQSEITFPVTTARVVVADYSLLKLDFAHLQALEPDAIDAWLIQNTAYIARTQAVQTLVNSPIQILGTPRPAYRQLRAGRTLLMEVGDSRLIDAKGTGAPNPVPLNHRNGLATLGEALREFLFEKLVHFIFAIEKCPYQTVGSYAVIDWGFDVKNRIHRFTPAGLLLRRVSKREGLFEREILQIEKLLRKYGLTSVMASDDENVEQINIQGSGAEGILDFGTFHVAEEFTQIAKPYQSKVSFNPKSRAFVQPCKERRIPFSVWGHTITGKNDPQYDNLWIWCHKLAESFRLKVASRKDVEEAVLTLLEAGLSFEPKCKPTRPRCDGSRDWVETVLCNGF